jgi:hypothetical protein
MVRKLIALTAIAAMSVALAATAGAKPQVKHVKSTISLTFTNGSTYTTPYGQDHFSGHVKAKKGCKKKRTVSILGTSLTGKTDSSGDYDIVAGDVAPGTYTAKVAKKKRKTNNGTKIICKAATSAPVTVP